MRRVLVLITVLTGASLMTACESSPPPLRWAIAVHGGAGSFNTLTDPAEIEATKRDLAAALEAGRAILAAGGTSLDAAEQVVRILEDNPRFNAGKGAVFTSAGGHELDATIMDGRSLKCGAVGGVRTVKNPVSLARRVMQDTPHILLAGPGADAFAQQVGAEQVDQKYFYTQKRYEQLQKVLEKRKQEEQKKQQSDSGQGSSFTHTPGGKRTTGGAARGVAPSSAPGRSASAPARGDDDVYYGTVGCVALDAHGNLAAATSTGGLTAKMPGRLGDSPLIGAGTYADNQSCAVSGTGTGERFIEHAVAFHVGALMRYKGLSVEEAARIVVFERLKKDQGGLIAVSRTGDIAMPYNTKAMIRGAADARGRFEVFLRGE